MTDSTQTPLARAERLDIARTPGRFVEQLRGAMLFKARYDKDGGATGPVLTLANNILDDSNAYIARFADVAVFDGRFDAFYTAADFDAVTDGDAQDVVGAVWALFIRE